MALQPGSRVGSYEVIDTLGAGGMGEVYRARDSKLGREVALKVLPDQFVSDADRLARFLREAQLLASLNHPNIAHDSRSRRVRRSHARWSWSWSRASPSADRIASGRAAVGGGSADRAADRRGAGGGTRAWHRPSRPEARQRQGARRRVGKSAGFWSRQSTRSRCRIADCVSQSPTLSVHATQAGIILGTAAYMSPEQARGKSVDSRTDIWAFGVVLFEMLAGRRPFDGDEVSDTLASVLKTEPHWELLPRTPAGADASLVATMFRERSAAASAAHWRRTPGVGGDRASRAGGAGPDRHAAPRARRVGITARSGCWRSRHSPDQVRRSPRVAGDAARDGDAERTDHVFFDCHLTASPLPIPPAVSGARRSGFAIWHPPRRSPSEGRKAGSFRFGLPTDDTSDFLRTSRLKRISVDGGVATTIGRALTPAGGLWGTGRYHPVRSGG